MHLTYHCFYLHGTHRTHSCHNIHSPPSLWLRYVDDTFCILNKYINDFYTHLNSICSHIQFTIEKELSFSLQFLNVAMLASLCTAFYLPEFTENPRTPTDIFITRHITANITISLLPKLYSARLTLTSQIKPRSTVNYCTYAVLCDKMGFLPEPLFQLLDGHALRVHHTIISLLLPIYKTHWKKLEEF